MIVLTGASFCVAAAGPATARDSVATRPSLRLLDTNPVTMRGSGFRPNERVVVVVARGAPRVRVARAGANGVFALKLALDVNACAGFSVSATGSQGSHATLKRAPGKCPAQ
jgi:hypothetical protein